MKEEDARNFLLVRAIESEDTSEALLTREDRQAATAAALADTGLAGRRGDQRFLATRSAFALTRLTARFPAIAHAARATRWPSWVNWAIPLAAFAIGIATNEIDGGKRLNIIAFPLFGVIAWNLAVYVLIALHAAGRLVTRRGQGDTPSWTTRLAARIAGVARRYQDPHQPVGRAIARFAREWSNYAGALTYARASRVLHLAAAALAAGILAGMYLRALGIEYRAGWESTFIGAETLHWLLGGLLAPATMLTGIAVPDATGLAALRWGLPANGENAGPWIHLFATTAALFVIVPRLVLAAWSAVSAARLGHFFAVPGREDFYVRRLLRDAAGGGNRVRVVPYGFTPPDGQRRVLDRMLTATFGDGTRISTDPAIAYGEEEEWLGRTSPREEDDYLMILFNLASTPEAENQGALVAGVKKSLDERHGGTGFAVILDETAYRQRLAGQAGAEDRIETRRLAWERMLAPSVAKPIGVDLGDEASPEQIRRLEVALTRRPVAAGGLK